MVHYCFLSMADTRVFVWQMIVAVLILSSIVIHRYQFIKM